MDLPADRSTPTSAAPVQPTLREAVRAPRRRRPTGEPPPLPYHLQTSGVGWLIAAGVLVVLSIVVFPVTYQRGRSAHLDVTGARGMAIRRALEHQLGLIVQDIKPFGLSGSAGSTTLRITVKGADGEDPTQLFGKLYAQSHLRADRWYKLGRELLYGRLEDEKPFNTVRRLVQQE